MTRRFLLDNDGSSFFGHTMGDNIEASIDEAIWECPEQVTTYLLCAGAARFYYPTRVGEVHPRIDWRVDATHGFAWALNFATGRHAGNTGAGSACPYRRRESRLNSSYMKRLIAESLTPIAASPP